MILRDRISSFIVVICAMTVLVMWRGEYHSLSLQSVHIEMIDRLGFSPKGLIAQKDACWSPNSDPAYVEKFRRSAAPSLRTSVLEHSLSKHQFFDRWSNTATDGTGLVQGEVTTLTWSFVPDGTSIYGYNGEATSNSSLIEFLDTQIGAGPGGTDLTNRPWFVHFQSVFDRWEELTGIRYIYEPNDDGSAWTVFSIAGGQLGVRGDVRISGHYIDGESGSNVLAYNFFPNYGDMVLDTGNPSFYGNASNNYRRLRNTLSHEHGHGMGGSHVESNNAAFLMEPFINTSFDGPQEDDILGANRQYGDALEPNDDVLTATPLGLISGGTVEMKATVSVDDDSDTDYYYFSVTGRSKVDITLTPTGTTYNQGPQGGSQSSLNAAALNDLTLQLLDTDGITVLASANNTGQGGSETIEDILLPNTGVDYFVRVTGADNNVQMYELSVAVFDCTAFTPSLGEVADAAIPSGTYTADSLTTQDMTTVAVPDGNNVTFQFSTNLELNKGLDRKSVV